MIQKKNNRLIVGSRLNDNRFSNLTLDLFANKLDDKYVNYILDFSGATTYIKGCAQISGTESKVYLDQYNCYAIESAKTSTRYDFDFSNHSNGWGFVTYFRTTDFGKQDRYISLHAFYYPRNGAHGHSSVNGSFVYYYKDDDPEDRASFTLGDFNPSSYSVITDQMDDRTEPYNGEIHEILYLHTNNLTRFFYDKKLICTDTKWNGNVFTGSQTAFRLQLNHGEHPFHYTQIIKGAMLKNVDSLPSKYISSSGNLT